LYSAATLANAVAGDGSSATPAAAAMVSATLAAPPSTVSRRLRLAMPCSQSPVITVPSRRRKRRTQVGWSFAAATSSTASALVIRERS
jgi:hypothetical protein